MSKLTTRGIKALVEQKEYGDGRYGLALKVSAYIDKDGNQRISKSWVQKLTINGVRVKRGIGSLRHCSLADARDIAHKNFKLARSGVDPHEEKRKAKTIVPLPTFKEMADILLEKKKKDVWSGTKENIVERAKNWMGRLEGHVLPTIGNVRIDRLTTDQVKRVVRAAKEKIPGTARRIYGIIHEVMEESIYRFPDKIKENVADAAKGELPKRKKGVQRETPQRAIPYEKISELLLDIDNSTTSEASKYLMRFTALAAVRSVESRDATWDEIDFKNKTWTVPAIRMKERIEHTVYLNKGALDVLDNAKVLHDGSPYIFPSPLKPGQPMSPNALMNVLRKRGWAEESTVHGFRATFTSWAEECTTADTAVIKMCIAQKLPDAVYNRYDRAERVKLRKDLMQMWCDYISGKGLAEVIELKLVKSA